MNCTVSEVIRAVNVKQIEALQVDATHPAYPFPPLSLGSEVELEEISLIVLSNRFLEATIAPSLGGRLLGLRDKRTGLEAIALPDTLALNAGGKRGVSCGDGVQLSFDGSERLTSMGSVEWANELDEERAMASITISEGGSWPFAFHVTFEVQEEKAELTIQAKVFNRSLQLQRYNGGLILPEACESKIDGQIFVESKLERAHWTLSSQELNFFTQIIEDGENIRGYSSRFHRARVMAPHQLDEWSALITPLRVRAGQKFWRLGPGLAVCSMGDAIQVEASRSLDALKVLVQTTRAETLEASVSAGPDEVVRIGLREHDVPTKGVAVLDRQRFEIIGPAEPLEDDMSNPSEVELPQVERPQPEPFYDTPSEWSSKAQLVENTFDVRLRAVAHWHLAVRAIQIQDWNEAVYRLEQTLLYNGEDTLAWWLKSRCETFRSQYGDARQELMNAHYLAPLEPLLRVEALLNQVGEPQPEANPILRSYASDRETMLGTVGSLIEVGLISDAMRLISEWLKFQDFPMLRYVLAYCTLESSRMDIEAGEQMRFAATMPFEGPYPHRPIESRVLQELSKRWRNDPKLQTYVELDKLYSR